MGPEADSPAQVGLHAETAVGARRGFGVAQVLAVGQNLAVAAVEAHQHDGAGQRLAVGPVHDRALDSGRDPHGQEDAGTQVQDQRRCQCQPARFTQAHLPLVHPGFVSGISPLRLPSFGT